MTVRVLQPRHMCEWCEEPMPAGKRRDATTCSKRCRQAKSRFKVRQAERIAGERPMRFAYADPPYPGLAHKWYRGEEVDHAELVERLMREYPDGWALSTSSEALRDVWALCPDGTRLCVWVNGARKTKSYRALRAYEAVLVFGGRKRREPEVSDLTDVLSWGGRQHSHPEALPGMKPAAFCEWLFRLLGAGPDDSLEDLFPGSGAVRRAWALYTTGSLPTGDPQLEIAAPA